MNSIYLAFGALILSAHWIGAAGLSCPSVYQPLPDSLTQSRIFGDQVTADPKAGIAHDGQNWWLTSDQMGLRKLSAEEILRTLREYPNLCESNTLRPQVGKLEPFLSTWSDYKKWGAWKTGWNLGMDLQLSASGELMQTEQRFIEVGTTAEALGYPQLGLWLGWKNVVGTGNFPADRKFLDSNHIDPGSLEFGLSVPGVRWKMVQAAWTHSPYSWLEPSIKRMREGIDTLPEGELLRKPFAPLKSNLSSGWAQSLEFHYGWAYASRWVDPFLTAPAWEFGFRELPLGETHSFGVGFVQAKQLWANHIELDICLWQMQWPIPRSFKPWQIRWKTSWDWSSPNNWAARSGIETQIPWIWNRKGKQSE